jgi:hypothetical protein
MPIQDATSVISESSSEVSNYRPRDTSYQPIEENFFFADSSGQSGPKPSSLLPPSSSQMGIPTESSVATALSTMATILGELENLKSEVERYQGINLSLVEELLAANCPELAEQKQSLYHVETILSEQLDHLFSGWTFDRLPPSWEMNGSK